MSGCVAIIQARMGSSRLPGKVLADICRKPMLWHVIRRTNQSRFITYLVVATSHLSEDDPIAEHCRRENVECFRGSEQDVLDRYYQSAVHYGARDVVRITADCPLLDPNIVDLVIDMYQSGNYDYVSNLMPRTFPIGLSAEVFSFDTLESAWREAKWQSEREHVTPYIMNHPEYYRLGNVVRGDDLSSLRWTVDESRDLEFVRSVYSRFANDSFGMDEIIELLARRPELTKINEGIGHDDNYKKSLREDRKIR